MFDIGLQEMLLIGVIALLVFGPTKLPELGRMFGRAMREFRRASDEFRSTVETNLHINEPDHLPDPVRAETPPEFVPVTLADAPGAETSADATTEAGTEAVAVEAPPAPFCAQQHSRIFHRSECAWVPRIPAASRVYLSSVAEGRAQGFVTCPVCEPWEPEVA